jgi:hypothetical protein
MKINLTFASTTDANNFLATTGETDIANVNVGLINLAVKAPGFVSGAPVGDAIEFLVKQSDGTWTTELIQDPFARIAAGDVIEPASAPIKMLAANWAVNRMENRFPPFLEDVLLAEVNQQRAVEIIVVDSGINASHTEFQNATIDNLYALPAFAGNFTDELKHGTFIASLIVGKTLGINKTAVIKNVKITGATKKPTLVELGDAFDAILAYHNSNPSVPKVVNLSWRIPRSGYIDAKIASLISAGMLVVAAAGNEAVNIDDITPAGTSGTLVVGASDENDQNLFGVYGTSKKVRLFAPGKDVIGADFASTTGYSTASGSSWSAGFASAAAGMFFTLGATCPTADEVIGSVIKDATVLSAGDTESACILHVPNAARVQNNTEIYLSNYTLDELTNNPPVVDIIFIFPSTLRYTGNYELVFDDAETASLMAPSTLSGSVLTLRVAPGTTLPEGTKVKKVSFKLSSTVDGLSMVSPKIDYFITSNDATYLTDVAPQVTQLESDINANAQLFLLWGGSYCSSK